MDAASEAAAGAATVATAPVEPEAALANARAGLEAQAASTSALLNSLSELLSSTSKLRQSSFRGVPVVAPRPSLPIDELDELDELVPLTPRSDKRESRRASMCELRGLGKALVSHSPATVQPSVVTLGGGLTGQGSIMRTASFRHSRRASVHDSSDAQTPLSPGASCRRSGMARRASVHDPSAETAVPLSPRRSGVSRRASFSVQSSGPSDPALRHRPSRRASQLNHALAAAAQRELARLADGEEEHDDDLATDAHHFARTEEDDGDGVVAGAPCIAEHGQFTPAQLAGASSFSRRAAALCSKSFSMAGRASLVPGSLSGGPLVPPPVAGPASHNGPTTASPCIPPMFSPPPGCSLMSSRTASLRRSLDSPAGLVPSPHATSNPGGAVPHATWAAANASPPLARLSNSLTPPGSDNGTAMSTRARRPPASSRTLGAELMVAHVSLAGGGALSTRTSMDSGRLSAAQHAFAANHSAATSTNGGGGAPPMAHEVAALPTPGSVAGVAAWPSPLSPPAKELAHRLSTVEAPGGHGGAPDEFLAGPVPPSEPKSPRSALISNIRSVSFSATSALSRMAAAASQAASAAAPAAPGV